MDLPGMITGSPQWKAFQQQLVALVQVVQDTNVRVRRMEAAQAHLIVALGQAKEDLTQSKEPTQ